MGMWWWWFDQFNGGLKGWLSEKNEGERERERERETDLYFDFFCGWVSKK